MSVLMRSRLGRAAAVLGGSGLVAAGMLAAGAGPASATVLSCGSTVITSVTLTANVDCTSDTSDNGLNIGAADVTVNLNGYSILGPGSGSTYGIYDNGYSGVTVQDGTISGFYVDAYFEGASGSDLTGIVMQHVTTANPPGSQQYGVYGEYLDGASIQHLSVRNAYDGIDLYSSQDSTVTRNTVTAPAQYGLYDDDGDANTWSGNTVAMLAEAATGLYLDEDTAQVAEGNTVTGGPGYSYGGYLYQAATATVSGNKLSHLYIGIYDEGSAGATFSTNKGTGDDWGIYSYITSGETYTGNNFSGGSVGIEADYPTGVTLRHNTTDGNSTDGVFLYSDGESGYSATLAGNTGNDNRYGLYSQFPTSGYGNTATGNKVVNCHDVHCKKATATSELAAAPPHRTPRLPAVAIAAPRR